MKHDPHAFTREPLPRDTTEKSRICVIHACKLRRLAHLPGSCKHDGVILHTPQVAHHQTQYNTNISHHTQNCIQGENPAIVSYTVQQKEHDNIKTVQHVVLSRVTKSEGRGRDGLVVRITGSQRGMHKDTNSNSSRAKIIEIEGTQIECIPLPRPPITQNVLSI